MASKSEVLELYHANAEMTAAQIAGKLDCDTAYVRATLQRSGLQSRPSKPGRPPISAEEKAEREEDQRDLDILYDLQDGHTQTSVARHWGVPKTRVHLLERARKEAN